MEDDTRQVRSDSIKSTEHASTGQPDVHSRPQPKHEFPKSQAGKMWEALGNPVNPANEMPGGMINTAGGRPKEVTWKDAFRFSSFGGEGPKFYQTGGARDALLVGIGSGGALGGVHFILRGLSKMLVTTNIAVLTFTVTAGGMHYWCSRRQMEEAKGIAAAVSGMKLLHEKKAREKAVADAAAAARKQKEEEEKIKNQRWYKFW